LGELGASLKWFAHHVSTFPKTLFMPSALFGITREEAVCNSKPEAMELHTHGALMGRKSGRADISAQIGCAALGLAATIGAHLPPSGGFAAT
jgi:hypothetical protein